ncbi:MAG: GTPase-activating protein [Desulfuromonadales bacterium]|nr:GTPase-activating protein [Desulfuromonadales bacterium]
MILLPRGNPVREKVNPGKINLPDALGKLQKSNFTGYLRFDTLNGTGIIIFTSGKLISALFDSDGENLIAYDAIARIFELSLDGKANLDIYKLSSDLAMSVHALLHGKVLYKGQELKLIDIKSLLGKLKEDKMSGCLRIYTDEKIALIFYRDGNPLGFFHDGSTDIETQPGESMSVARLPGAKVDVLSTGGADEIDLADLLGSADLGALWRKAQEMIVRQRKNQKEAQNRDRQAQENDLRVRLQVLLRSTAEAHIGRIGSSLIEKEFEKYFPEGQGWDDVRFNKMLENLNNAAKMVAGPSAIKKMLDDMRKGIRALLHES